MLGEKQCTIQVKYVKNNVIFIKTKHEHMLLCTPKTQSSLLKNPLDHPFKKNSVQFMEPKELMI